VLLKVRLFQRPGTRSVTPGWGPIVFETALPHTLLTAPHLTEILSTMPPTLRSHKRQPEASATALSSQIPPSAATTVSESAPPANLKRRVTRQTKNETQPNEMSSAPDEERPLLDGPVPETPQERQSWAQRNQWIVFALASGACAAFNGVFAKL
jgi:hypothetical protein